MGVLTPPGILAFANLFVAKPRQHGNPQSDLVFSANLIFDEAAQKTPAYDNLRKAIKDAATDKWGSKMNDTQFAKRLRWPLLDGADSSYDGFGPGKRFIRPWTKIKPGIVDANRNDILAAQDVWAGQLARMMVVPFAYENSGNMGVSLTLEHVQILKSDMPRLDGRKSAKDAFNDGEGDSYAGAPADADLPF